MTKFGKYREVHPLWLHVPIKYILNVPGSKDSNLCIVEIYGNNALCAWHNNSTGRCGIPFLCPIRDGKLFYKGVRFFIDKYSGNVF